MELERWCGDNFALTALEPVGRLKDQSIPRELDGMLGALMLQGAELGADIEDALVSRGLTLPKLPYRVVRFVLDDPRIAELKGRVRYNCRLNMYRALQKHLAETLRETVGGFLVLMMGGLFGVLYSDAEDYMLDACRETVAYAAEELEFAVHVSVSGLWRGSDKMETAYRMLQDVENGRAFYTSAIDRVFQIPERALERISDTQQQTAFEQNFFLSADRVCGAVQAEDASAAAEHLRDQLLKIAQNCIGMPYPLALNLTMNRFMSLLQYRLVEQDLADWLHLARADFGRGLSACGTLTEFLAESDRIARNLVDHARERKQNRRAALLREIREYVVENATDINMGLTAVARQFQLKPREAAETFRAYYGESVNDVIHKTRVKKAKQLLLTTDMPVREIAGAVGYCSLATMYRAFANVEGVAPGKLRQNKLKG